MVDSFSAAVTARSGDFEAPDVATGTYTVRAVLSGYLSLEATGVQVLVDETTRLPTAQLRGGDVDEDKEVGLLDLVTVATHYHTLPPSDPRADINKDGRIDVFDLVLVAGNYRRVGPLPWSQ